MFTAAPSFSSFFCVLLLTAFFAAGLAPARAAEKPQAELSEQVAAKMQDLRALEDAKPPKIDEAMALVDSLLLTAGPTSYDRAMLSRIKTQYLFQKNDPNSRFAAIGYMETALNLSDTYGYFNSTDAQQLRFYLASLWWDQGAINKDPIAKRAAITAARTRIERWLEVNRTDPTATPPSADFAVAAEILYASILDAMGAELDPKHVDLDLVKMALAEAAKGLRLSIRPNETLYLIQLASLQQLGNYADAADILEHLLKAKPDNKSYWQQLTSFYAVLADDAEKAKDNKKAFEFNVRAIVTVERAHKYGTMNDPDSNMELFSFYFNIGQYQQAAEMLEAGLHDGTIKSNKGNWMLLADTYQQLHKELKAVAVLKDAAKQFPESGQFNFAAAQVLYGLNKTADALVEIQNCVAKGGGDKPAKSWLFYAYLAIELQKFELAAQAVDSADKCPHSPDEANTIANLRDAVRSAIAQRDAAFPKAK